MKVVFDTNIYISAFVIPGGNAEKAYLHAIEGDFELCTSVAILLKTSPWLKVLSDDPDNRILECALKAEADFLVTGDKHLLKLRNYENRKIVKLSAFLGILQQATNK